MCRSSTRRLLLRAALLGLLATASTCVTFVRVPLAVPLATVGGSRPATPQGLQLIGEFGDGVWGQEQERAEISGGGVGFAIGDRIEFSTSGYASARTVRDSLGNEHVGELITGVRGKIRLGDLFGGRASLGIHIAHVSSQRNLFDVQDERLTAWDVALPLEVYRVDPLGADYRLGMYVAPRLVSQTFEDRSTGEITRGTLKAALVGVAARWRHFAITGEINIAHTPTMTFSNRTFPGGWILLPMGSVRGILPIGE